MERMPEVIWADDSGCWHKHYRADKPPSDKYVRHECYEHLNEMFREARAMLAKELWKKDYPYCSSIGETYNNTSLMIKESYEREVMEILDCRMAAKSEGIE